MFLTGLFTASDRRCKARTDTDAMSLDRTSGANDEQPGHVDRELNSQRFLTPVVSQSHIAHSTGLETANHIRLSDAKSATLWSKTVQTRSFSAKNRWHWIFFKAFSDVELGLEKRITHQNGRFEVIARETASVAPPTVRLLLSDGVNSTSTARNRPLLHRLSASLVSASTQAGAFNSPCLTRAAPTARCDVHHQTSLLA